MRWLVFIILLSLSLFLSPTDSYIAILRPICNKLSFSFIYPLKLLPCLPSSIWIINDATVRQLSEAFIVTGVKTVDDSLFSFLVEKHHTIRGCIAVSKELTDIWKMINKITRQLIGNTGCKLTNHWAKENNTLKKKMKNLNITTSTRTSNNRKQCHFTLYLTLHPKMFNTIFWVKHTLSSHIKIIHLTLKSYLSWSDSVLK